jgi:hypothetical protein
VGAEYIVTDLYLRSRFSFSLLDSELTGAGLHGGSTFGDIRPYRGVWSAVYSSSVRCCRHPAEAIDELVGIVEDLGYEAREQWDGCISRRFDIGYTCTDERFASKWQIKAPVLRRLAAVNGELVMTIYRADPPKEAT